MSCSDAQLTANRRNAALSRGPKSPETKAISARNSLKHGLTGEGIVLPDEDVVAVNERFEALQAEMAPKTSMGQVLVRRVAFLSVRLERAARQEAKQVGLAMRLASEKFVDRRMLDVEKMMDWIAAEPATNARRLRGSVEGVDRLIAAWLDLDSNLADSERVRWTYSQWQRLDNIEGRRPEDQPISRDGALCKAIWGESEYLEAGEVEGFDAKEVREWARVRLRERIAARLAELRTLRGTFDPEALAKDCAEAAQRAIFDASKEATLARKYEAAAERGLYRALKELREVEAEAAARAEAGASQEEAEGCESLGSFSTGPIGEPIPPASEPPGTRPGVGKRPQSGTKGTRSGRQTPS